LLWALILLVMIVYLFAVMFTQGTAMHLSANLRSITDHWPVDLSPDSDPLLIYWSTLPRSMFTLFMSITGGISWVEVVQPLSQVHWFWVALFVAYICFAQMCVLNVLTGVFCQNAIDSAQYDQDLVTQSILLQKNMYVKRIKEIFSQIDDDGSGGVTIHELMQHLENEHMLALWDSLGLDVSDVWTLFKLIDSDHGSVIELEEFVAGCLRLKGNAKGLDMAKLYYEHRSLASKLAVFMKRTDRALSSLRQPRQSRDLHEAASHT